jgi:transcriptional regulator with XRE-family HTH domain
MAPNPDATVSRLRLCNELREARDSVGLTQRQVAEILDWSQSKIIRIERGHVGVSRTDLWALLNTYGIVDQRRIAEVIALADQSKRQDWVEYRDVLNSDFRTYLGLEGAASAIRQFELTFVPGLLQTEEYAWHVIHALAPPHESESVQRRQMKARIARQSIVDREDPPQMHFMLDEAVLRRRVDDQPGGADVMRRQLRRLKELDAKPHINIYVIPFASGIHLGLLGPFVILEFPEPGDDDLLFIESGRKARATRSAQSEIKRYKRIFWGLESVIDRRPLGEVVDHVLRDLP